MGDWRTYRFMFSGFLLAIFCSMPFLAWVYNYPWEWVRYFPLSWIATGMSAFMTFFHEIGHTVFAWFYGYVTLPSFDFQHGGGMAWMLTGQLLPLNFALYGLLLYGIYFFREYRVTQALLVAIGVFHLATAYTSFHMSVINFMGPAFEVLIAGFFLYRAWFDLAPRGNVERFLNAFFGFGMIIHVGINGWALIHSKAMRLVYFEQKGQHGFGDFDKIANALHVDFEKVIIVWLLLAGVCLLVPFLHYIASKPKF